MTTKFYKTILSYNDSDYRSTFFNIIYLFLRRLNESLRLIIVVGVLMKVLHAVVYLLGHRWSVLVHWYLKLLYLQWIILLCLVVHLLVLHLILLLGWYHVILRLSSHLLIAHIWLGRWVMHVLRRMGYHLRQVPIHLLRLYHGLRHFETFVHWLWNWSLVLECLVVLLSHTWSRAFLAFIGYFTSFTFVRFYSYIILNNIISYL